MLTRLGLFCETVRVFLLAVSREHPGLGEGIGDGLAQRYLKETGEASPYEDARSGEGRRRLPVCARDVYRLVDRFRGTAVAQIDEYGLLERLLREQCHVGRHGDGRPGADDDDAGEGKAPIALREPGEVRPDSLQTPHDPQVTYSGHKGKGYEVQVAETCESDNAVQMITHVEVTPSSGSDSVVTTRVTGELSERGIGSSELWADTSYGSGRNGWEAERRGTELVSPVSGRSQKEPGGGGDEPVRLTASGFYIDVTATRSATCPAGHGAVAEYEDEDAPERVEIHFARAVCEPPCAGPRPRASISREPDGGRPEGWRRPEETPCSTPFPAGDGRGRRATVLTPEGRPAGRFGAADRAGPDSPASWPGPYLGPL